MARTGNGDLCGWKSDSKVTNFCKPGSSVRDLFGRFIRDLFRADKERLHVGDLFRSRMLVSFFLNKKPMLYQDVLEIIYFGSLFPIHSKSPSLTTIWESI